jgi:muramoyltetrapeptide carboxypeptidase
MFAAFLISCRMPTTAPAPLRPGDQIAIVCPARKASHEELAPAVAILESWGLQVVLGASTL